MQIQPTDQHTWLHRLVGDWEYAHEYEGPDGKPVQLRGTERVRKFGDVWVICEGRGEMPGGGIGDTIMTLGFDPAKNRFVGTFIGTMMNFQWVYDGALNSEGNALALDTVGPDFVVEGKSANYRDTIEFIDENTRTLSAQVQAEDGSWKSFMSAKYTRVN